VSNRFSLGDIAIGALVSFAPAAFAADLPVPSSGPAYYPSGMTPVPYYNWTGFYIGGNFGGAWASQNSAVTTDAVTGASISSGSTNSSGFAGGGQIGANWFIYPSYMIGIEGDFDALSNDNTIVSPDGSNQHEGKLKYLSTLRGRFGLTVDRLLFYGTAGFAWGQDQITRTQNFGTVNNATAGTVETITNNRFGWAAGAGFEYAFAGNWTARAEYLFANLGAVNYTFPLAQRTTATSFQGISLIRAGINYKFGFDGAPIATRD
jgi:outer membrane immunogenic protein